MRRSVILFVWLFLLLSWIPVQAGQQGEAPEVNLLSIHEGTIPVIFPPCYNNWLAEGLLDDNPATGWASEEGQPRDNVIVFEMIGPGVIDRFGFDTAAIDEDGAGAGEIRVEVSGTSPETGFETVLQATLADRTDGQVLAAQKKKAGQWVRLTLRNNHGNPDFTELFSFRGFGQKGEAPSSLPDISGTYDTDYSNFHVRQQGSALIGCYESNDGLLDGVIEGRLMKITWKEGERSGPAVMVFHPDGNGFKGYWWDRDAPDNYPGGAWNGSKTSPEVGGCPHWAGSLGGELEKQLNNGGRARVYGIRFDHNAAAIRPESEPVLREVLALLTKVPDWKMTIEGHTDATGGDTYNQTLSQNRADAVKAFLVRSGIDPDRLDTQGMGAASPVADNATELGRAQNRRVELVRQ